MADRATGSISFSDLQPTDLVEQAKVRPAPVAPAKELDRLIAELTIKPDGVAPSVILVAPTGSGKTSLVHLLAHEILRAERGERAPLPVEELFQVQLGVLLAGTNHQGELEKRYRALVAACKKDKRYLFIDEIHTMERMGRSEGGIPWLQMLKEDLRNGSLRLIGATTPSEYADLFGDDLAARQRFSRFDLAPASHADVVAILQRSIASLEGVRVTCEQSAIEDAARLQHHTVAQPGLGKGALVEIAKEKLVQTGNINIQIARADIKAYATRKGLQEPLAQRLSQFIAAARPAFTDCATIVGEVARIVAEGWDGCQGPHDSAREAGRQAVEAVRSMLEARLGPPPRSPGTGSGILAVYLAPKDDAFTVHFGYCLLKRTLADGYKLRFVGGGGNHGVRRKTDYVRAVSTGLFYSDTTANQHDALAWNGITVGRIADEVFSMCAPLGSAGKADSERAKFKVQSAE